MKKYIALFVFMLALALSFYFYFQKNNNNASNSKLYTCIPNQFPLALQSTNFAKLFEKIDTYSYAEVLQNQDWYQASLMHLAFVDSLQTSLFPEEKGASYSEVMLAFGNAGNDQLGLLLAFTLNEKWKQKHIEEALNNAALSYTTYEFEGENIYTLKATASFPEAHFAIINYQMVFGLKSSFVEEAILSIQAPNENWSDLMSQFDNDQDAVLFVKPKELHFLSSYFLKAASFETSHLLEKITGNTALQLHFFENDIAFSGQATGDEGTLLKFLNNVDPSEQNLQAFLPSNTASFQAMTLGEAPTTESNELPISYIQQLINKTYTFFTLEVLNEDLNSQKGALLAIETENVYDVLATIDPNISTYSNVASHKIYLTSAGKVFNEALLSPNYFSDSLFILALPDFCVLSSHVSVLEQYLVHYEASNFLPKNASFSEFKNSSASKTNIDLFLDFSLMQSYLTKISTENTWQNNISKVNIQFVNLGNKVLCQGKLSLKKEAAATSKILWTSKLDTIAATAAHVVINHNNQAKEILVQDLRNQLYLLNSAGEILWKIALDETIQGKILQLDYYKNKKLQYLFHSANKIYIVDRNGAFVDGFPIKLPSKASNSLLLVDYDKTGDYRFMIACDNGNIYGYEKNGTPLPGWNPKKDVGIIKQDLQHLIVDGKDYIYFNNQDGVFFALNRKAEERFAPVKTGNFRNGFTYNGKVFVGGDKGMVFTVDASGALVNKEVLDSSFRFFQPAFSVLNNSEAYAFASSSIFKYQQSAWKSLASYSSESPIVRLETYQVEQKRWFVLYTATQAFLLDELGNLHKDFPIETKVPLKIVSLIEGKSQLILYADGLGNVLAKEITWSSQ